MPTAYKTYPVYPIPNGYLSGPVKVKEAYLPDKGEDNIIRLRDIGRAVKRYKKLIFAITALVALSVLVVNLLTPPTYRASSTIQIDTDAVKVLAYDVETNERPANDKDFYQTQYEVLQSHSLARMTIDQLDLESVFKNKQQDKNLLPWSMTDILAQFNKQLGVDSVPKTGVQDEKSPLEDRFLKNLSVIPVKNSRIVRVSYDDHDPVLAANIVNAMANNYIKMNLDRRVNSASYAKEFLNEQLAQAKVRLEESENKLVAYAKSQEIINTDDKQTLPSQKLIDLNRDLTEVERERIVAESKYKQERDSLGNVKVLDNPTVQELKKTLAQLQGEYQENLRMFKPGYPLIQQLESQIVELKFQIDQETKKINNTIQSSLRDEYLSARQKEEKLRDELVKQKSELLELRDKSVGYNTLQREVETNRNLYEGLLQRMKEVSVAGGIGKNNISILDVATVPYTTYAPRIKVNVFLGSLVGLVLGISVALLLSFTDDTLRSSDDVERLLNLPVLGLIPALNSKGIGTSPLVTVRQSNSLLAEAFRSLRTNLLLATVGGAPKILTVTSAMPMETKSSTCLQLAATFAQAGKTVLLIDADLRRPSIHRYLGLDNLTGLSDCLLGLSNAEDVIQKTSMEGVWVLTAGPISSNPVELLSSEQLMDILRITSAKFDMVMLDSPPIMGLADALILANRAQATLLVTAFAQTRKRLLTDAYKRLRQAQANVIGVVFSKVENDFSRHYQEYLVSMGRA